MKCKYQKCTNKVPPSKGKKPSEFCSTACKQADYRLKKKVTKNNAQQNVTITNANLELKEDMIVEKQEDMVLFSIVDEMKRYISVDTMMFNLFARLAKMCKSGSMPKSEFERLKKRMQIRTDNLFMREFEIFEIMKSKCESDIELAEINKEISNTSDQLLTIKQKQLLLSKGYNKPIQTKEQEDGVDYLSIENMPQWTPKK